MLCLFSLSSDLEFQHDIHEAIKEDEEKKVD